MAEHEPDPAVEEMAAYCARPTLARKAMQRSVRRGMARREGRGRVDGGEDARGGAGVGGEGVAVEDESGQVNRDS